MQKHIYEELTIAPVNVGIISPHLGVIITSKCGCSTISFLADKFKRTHICVDEASEYEYSHFDERDDTIWHRLYESTLTPIADVLNMGITIVAIYREPIERVISAKYKVARDCDFEAYLQNVCFTFDSVDATQVDRHIAPQSLQYDTSYVDLFVDLKDLNRFLSENGIENVAINKTPVSERLKYDEGIIDKYKERLMEIYRCDYEMIANIPQYKRFCPKEDLI